jgi:LCP family protein required for cell wall assembly
LPESADPSGLAVGAATPAVEPDPAAVEPDPAAQPRKPVAGGRVARLFRRRLVRLTALVLGLVVLVTAAGLGVAGWLYYRTVEGHIARVDAFTQVPAAERPPAVAGKAMNVLILGSDSRDRDLGGSRTDTIILAHLPSNRKKAQLTSIPRDTWVRIPKSADGRAGGKSAKINAAFALGGVPLMVRTVESFTSVRVDHVVLIDFAGFEDIIDALGGVDIHVDKTFTTIGKPRLTFKAGTHTLDGASALLYARQRQQFRDGDFTRIRHQQDVIEAVLTKAATTGLLTNPTRLNAFLRAATKAITVDKTFSIFKMAAELGSLRSDDLQFLTSPSRGTGRVGTQSVVFPDKQKAAKLYDAIKRDRADAWFKPGGA